MYDFPLLLFLCFKFYFKLIYLILFSRKEGDGNPVWFTLGIREAIKGWDKGLQNMCTGERRKLTIPPSLAYGSEGKGRKCDIKYMNKKRDEYIYILKQVRSLQAVP